MVRLAIRHFRPGDAARIDARPDFRAELECMFGDELAPLGGAAAVFAPAPGGIAFTLVEGAADDARPLAVGGVDPEGGGVFALWLYASDLSRRGWAMVFAQAEALTLDLLAGGATRVEAVARVELPKARSFIERLGFRPAEHLAGFGPGGEDYVVLERVAWA